MISNSTLLHVRLPFSWFLLPIYMMGLVFAPSVDPKNAIIVFIVLHVFLFTASNGFNSYYDRDEYSIGGLRSPPQVTKDLLWFSLTLDAIGFGLALLVSWEFALGCFIYGIASKLYSWNVTRIKKYGVLSWLFVGLGQGTCIFLLVTTSITDPSNAPFHINVRNMLPAFFAGCFLLGIYPLTQIYQHAEDARRHDMTLSRMLGIKNTFFCAAIFIVTAMVGFFFCLRERVNHWSAYLFLGLLIPAVYYFGRWFFACRRHPEQADFDHCMRMNILASTGVNLFGITAFFLLNK
jgi:4-hydroxybenzoate polyprenyltransferase